MEIVLKNNRLRVVVDTYGAEITKVENFTDGETVKDCVWTAIRGGGSAIHLCSSRLSVRCGMASCAIMAANTP